MHARSEIASFWLRHFFLTSAREGAATLAGYCIHIHTNETNARTPDSTCLLIVDHVQILLFRRLFPLRHWWQVVVNI